LPEKKDSISGGKGRGGECEFHEKQTNSNGAGLIAAQIETGKPISTHVTKKKPCGHSGGRKPESMFLVGETKGVDEWKKGGEAIQNIKVIKLETNKTWARRKKAWPSAELTIGPSSEKGNKSRRPSGFLEKGCVGEKKKVINKETNENSDSRDNTPAGGKRKGGGLFKSELKPS